MCGIAGFIEPGRQAADLERLATAMAETLRHRGPDDGGVWTDEEAGVALANRRLAVRDTSPAGGQPMVSADGRYVLTYNGEVYDADALRAALEGRGHRFRGTSDTEVLLAACAEWGVADAVCRLNGMFAFALWDRTAHRLTLARDRLGIKPLYWAAADGLFLFASELKAMRAHPGWTPEIDRDALAAFARLSYVPAPHCIWQGARKLEPGTLLVLDPGSVPRLSRYWDMAGVAAGARTAMSMADAADGLRSVLRTAVRRRLVADVPLGIFLSGGLDSAVVAGLAQAESGAPVKTFTVGFAESGYDEAADAARIAAHLGTHHSDLRLTPAEARDLICELPRWFDEPFADSSQIATLLISRFARQSVTVALTGDGGDEVFAGYNRYGWAEHHWPRLRGVPRRLRRLAASVIGFVPPLLLDRLAAGMATRQAGEKLHKLARVLPLDDIDEAYRRLTGPGVDTAPLVPGGREPAPPEAPALGDAVERMQFLDTVGYLPDDILTKVDRATMAVGLEARVPFLDHEVVAFAWALPGPLKISGGLGKRVLRSVAERYLPPAFFAGRPKSGFAVPIETWLRGPLRDWAEALLAESALRRQGHFDPSVVRRWWREHLTGRRRRHQALWNVLMFQAWLETQSGMGE